jgi:beta-galactosidase
MIIKSWQIGCVATLLWLSADANARVTENFDDGWKFLRGSPPAADGWAAADASWQAVTVPHDWSIAGPFAETNLTGGAGAFLPSGVVWYHRHFMVPVAWSGQRVFVQFDGVMQNSDVWINGFHLGHRPNGYVSFQYELTAHLNPQGENVLAVRADTSAQPASRWYSGGGIYRQVRLVVTDPVHLDWNGVFVSTPAVSEPQATVQFQISVTNQSAASRVITVQNTVFSPEGEAVGTVASRLTVARGGAGEIRQQLALSKPELWGPDSPQLYRAVTKILADGAALDQTTTAFGIRDAKFTAAEGFLLNGHKLMLKGVCLHHDGGAFGVAVPLAIWEDRLQTLRALGVNAIRTAHQSPAPEFLDLCDRMGFLVMDEFFDCWTVGKNPFDYHLFFQEWSQRDAADIVRRDRNHPCVILWNIGNEIHDTRKPGVAIPIARGLVEVCHTNDPTRPVTQALFRPNATGDYTNGLADVLDVIGTNYRDNELLAAQRARPGRKIINTEQRHDRAQWLGLRDHSSLAGQFLWVGVDYLGESRRWPRIGYAGGLLNRTGAVKPMAFERQSWWSDAPMVRLARRVAPADKMPGDPGYGGAELFTQVQFADWTPRNPAPHDETVEAYSNCQEVELFLNGQSLGAQPIHADASPRVWKIPFAPGTLQAVARNGGQVAASDELRTAGQPARVQLETQTVKLKTGWNDVAIIRAAIVDANGIVVPQADDLISFSVSGPGVIAAVDNGDNDSHEPFQAAGRHAYHGTCTVFIKADPHSAAAAANVEVTAQAAGLTGGAITLPLSDSIQ